jgi:hypothetical protein
VNLNLNATGRVEIVSTFSIARANVRGTRRRRSARDRPRHSAASLGSRSSAALGGVARRAIGGIARPAPDGVARNDPRSGSVQVHVEVVSP